MSLAKLLKLAYELEIKYASGRLEVDLLPPPEAKDDDYWDFKIASMQKLINFFPQLWAPEYQSEFSSYVRGAYQRGEEQIVNQFGRLRQAKYDVIVTLKRVNNPNSVYLRGDYRYPSDPMSQYLLSTQYDLVPPVVGSTGMGNHLLDGHHRWRAYLLAGLAPLILEVKIEPSHSPVPKAVAIVDASATTKEKIK